MAAAAILNFRNFNFWSLDCDRVQYLLYVVYQISSKSDDFSLKYGDLTMLFNVKQVYRRRYESRRSSKPKLH